MMNETVPRETTGDAERRRGCGVDWSDAEIARLVRLRASGLSVNSIAFLMRPRTAQAIRLKLHRLNVIVEPDRAARPRGGQGRAA